MPFTKKNLDDRNFKQLFNDLKQRIPLYLPEWTDHNESDPGIAMAQLFAWLTETMLVRLNQVPDRRMYVAFLDLLDQAPRPALPAQVPVRLEVTPGGGHSYTGYEIRMSGAGAKGEMPFEADQDVALVGATLVRLLVDDGLSRQRVDVTAVNLKRNAWFSPFGTSRVRNRALYLGLRTAATPFGITALVPPGPPIPMRLFARLERGSNPATPVSTSLVGGVSSLESDLIWEGRGAGGVWVTLQASDDTLGLTQDGFVRILLPPELAPSRLDPTDVEELFWLRVRASSEAPETRRLRYLEPNVVILRQWRTHVEELLSPGSNGEAKQRRTVRYPPILRDAGAPVVVEVREPMISGGTSWIKWKESKEAAEPGFDPESEAEVPRTFAVSDDHTEIIFGEGRYQRIPPRGSNNLRVTYRSGGGRDGNLGLGSLSLVQPPVGVLSAEQLEAATGGADEEEIEAALERAPQVTKTMGRAVTLHDFETLAVELGASRAVGRNRLHPRYPAVPVTGAISLVVVPPPLPGERAPKPDQAFLNQISQGLEPYRVLTTEVFVLPPEYHQVETIIDLQIDDANHADRVREEVVEVMHRLLHPTQGGPDGQGWPLGGEIPYGLLVSKVAAVPGVNFVRSLGITLDGRAQPACSDVPLPSWSSLIESIQHVVKISARGRR